MKVQVVGVHWGAFIERNSLLAINEPTAAMEYSAPPLDSREDIEDWLTSHSGDFSEVMDFAALPDIEFKDEESGFFYWNCMFNEEFSPN